MITNGQIISQIRSNNKYLQDDNLISDRQIFNTAKAVASFLLQRQLSKRKLLSSDNVYTPFECVKLCKTYGTECDIAQEVAVSEELPQFDEGLYSYMIQGVFNIDNSEELYPTTIRDFINYQKLRIKPNRNFYLIKNKKIFVLNPDVKNINVYGYTIESIGEKCSSMYEREFRFPPYLLEDLYRICDERLINYHRTITDKTDDNREDNP